MAYTTIASHAYGGQWPTDYGTSGTLLIYCDQNFVADDGKSYIAGDGTTFSGEFVTKATITVASGTATIASFLLPTADVGNPTIVRYYGRIFDSRNAAHDYEFEAFHLRSTLSDSISFHQWQLDNKTPIRPQPDGAPTVSQMN